MPSTATECGYATSILYLTATLEASLAPRNDVPLWIAHQLYRVREVDDEGFLDGAVYDEPTRLPLTG